MEEPTSRNNLEDTRIKGNLDYTIDLFEPTHAIEKELLHFRKLELLFAIMICSPSLHMPTRKASRKEPLVDYS